MDDSKSDYRSTFSLNCANRKGGFIKVLSRDKSNTEQMSKD